MRNKETFIRLTASDNKLGFSDAFEAVVYGSIKSWCGQGKKETAVSFRQIQSYIPYVSLGCIRSRVKSLIDKKIVLIVGTETKIGGKIPIYKCSPDKHSSVRSMNSKRSQDEHSSVHHRSESVHHRSESVHGVGSKRYKEERRKEINYIFSFYLSKALSKEKLLPSREQKIKNRLKTFSVDEIKKAISNCYADDFWKRQNFDYIFKNDANMDKLLNLKQTRDVDAGVPISEWMDSPNYLGAKT